MTPELTALALAALLQALQIGIYAAASTKARGMPYNLGPRDEPRPQTGRTARQQRAMNNHFEGLILFTIAVLVVTLSKQSSSLTANCAYAFVAARVAYVPAYVLAWNPWRTVIWFVGFLATLAMILSALL